MPRAAHEVTAPAAWRRIDFISDLHLADSTPNAFRVWRDYLLATPADAVVILGDLFEAWLGDDSRHDGFEARVAEVLAVAASRLKLFFMAGNRDFLVGPEMLGACGVEALDDPTVMSAFGERALLTHGDAWCVDDVSYQAFRRVVRRPALQTWALRLPLAMRRFAARRLRARSKRQAATHRGDWADVHAPTSLGWMTANDAPVMVHGHTHRPASQAWGEAGGMRHVLTDWELDHGPNRRAEVLCWEPGRWRRLAPSEAVANAAERAI